MVSWAVPKGLPTQTGVRHLAVQTEDHPMEYNRFEGWIPEGHYGAGEVRIYDRGTYEPLEWTEKKVSFRLHGERHRGEWHLVKTRPGLAHPAGEGLGAGAAGRRRPSFLPMLAEGAKEPFNDPKWRFEPKLDGIRTLAYVTTDATRLVSRSGRDQTRTYPELGPAGGARERAVGGDRRGDRRRGRRGPALLRGPAAADEPDRREGDRQGPAARSP